MKHIIFINILKLLREISSFLQIGNPYGKAPLLFDHPSLEHKIYSYKNELDYISIWRLQNVVCSGLHGGLIIDSGNKVYSSFIAFPWGNKLHPGLSLPYIGLDKVYLERAIFLITPEAEGNYFHWIVDLLPRLLLIKKYVGNLSDIKLILHKSEKKYEIETFTLLGVKESNITRLSTFEKAYVKELIVTDYLNNGEKFSVWKKSLLDEFKRGIRNTKANKQEKIYLLRGQQTKRRLIGEEHLVILLKKIGFHIIEPQQMPLINQINTLYNAKIVVSIHGAALTNIIFCKESALVIELRSSDKAPEYFSELAKAYNLLFESVCIPPEHIYDDLHMANKQNLVLTDQSINLLLSKLSFIS